MKKIMRDIEEAKSKNVNAYDDYSISPYFSVASCM